MAAPKQQYIVDGSSVYQVYQINDEYVVIAPNFYKIGKSKIYDNKFDALYDKLIQQLSNGKDLQNFRSSPYYQRYIERLKTDNPEYMI